MSAPKPAPSPLILAAQTFENELARLEDLAAQLERASITTEKSLQRAAALLGHASSAHDQLSACLAGLVSAISTTQKRQEAALERVLVETRRVQERSNGYREVMTRLAELGERARAAQGPLESVSAGTSPDDAPNTILESLGMAEGLIEAVIADADALARAAEDGSWSDVTREAQALRQGMRSARNRLVLAKRAVASRAPS